MTETKVSYSVLEAADALGISEKTVRNELGAGRLRPHARHGLKILIPRSTLDSWIAERLKDEYEPKRKYVPPGEGKKRVAA